MGDDSLRRVGWSTSTHASSISISRAPANQSWCLRRGSPQPLLAGRWSKRAWQSSAPCAVMIAQGWAGANFVGIGRSVHSSTNARRTRCAAAQSWARRSSLSRGPFLWRSVGQRLCPCPSRAGGGASPGGPYIAHPLGQGGARTNADRIRAGARLSRRGAILARIGVVRAALSVLNAGGRWFPRHVGPCRGPARHWLDGEFGKRGRQAAPRTALHRACALESSQGIS